MTTKAAARVAAQDSLLQAAAGLPAVAPQLRPAQATRAWIDRLGHEAAFEEFIDYIMEGGHLPAFVRERGFSITAMTNWIEADVSRKMLYARAREERSHVYGEQILDVSRRDCSMPVLDNEGRLVGTRVDPGKVQQAKLEAENLKWLAARLMPRVYGDKLDLNATMSVTEASPKDLIQRINGLDPTLALAAARALGLTPGAGEAVTDVVPR